LKENSITDIIIVTGHLGNYIHDYFGDGSDFSVTISYYEETEPLGTAGALYKIADRLAEDFLLINGDIIFDMDLSRFISFHKEKNAFATLAAHPNNHPFDSALLITDTEDRVTKWLNKEEERLYYKNEVNAGIHVMTRKLLKEVKVVKEKIDLDRDILKPMICSGKIFAYDTPEYIRDMGTPERYHQVSRDIESGLVASRNLSNPQKAVFLDRDGTINEMNDFVKKPSDLILIEGAAEAVRHINSSGYLAILITNQPVIARGEVTLEGLEEIHNKLETDLGAEGAFLDDIFFCPHHPDKGFEGERVEYKIDCECRKPKPGMLLAAAKKYNIDLSASYMVGDDMRDVKAGIAGGAKAVFLKGNVSNKTEIVNGEEVLIFPLLKDFVEAHIK
jgi:D-glycero-D-manno-heptose 1,7-bisphosphate phosphatase